MTKKDIRRKYRVLRDQMGQDTVNVLSEQICDRLLHSSLYAQATCIFAYYPLGNEVDIRQVVTQAWKDGKQVAFPKVFGDEMRYFLIEDFSKLHPGSFGVMEPEETNPVNWEDALVLTPGVAFDRSGNRMGFGKGYYDRYFAQHRGCKMVGVAYELQMAEELPTQEHDIVLPFLVTEEKLWETRTAFQK
jgi:5-formyltetrahydrofolate cyclo-ligase